MRRLAFLITLWLVALIAPAPAWASRSASEAIAIAMVVPATHRGEQEAATLQEGAISRSPNRAQREARARLRGSQRGETALVGAKHELDLAGNVRRLRSAGGGDLGGYRYSAFGKTLEDTATSRLDQPFRWKGRPREVFGAGLEVYDMRARWWCPELGSFLSIDAYAFHDAKGTLWSWPRQNPVRWRDPSGHLPMDGGFTDRSVGVPAAPNAGAFQQGMGLGGLLGAYLDLQLLAPGLALLVDGGLFIQSDKDLPNLLLIGALPKGAFRPSPAQEAMFDARKAMGPTADCRQLSRTLVQQQGQGQIARLEPQIGQKFLPTRSGLPNDWAFHEAVQMPNGGVMDPLLQAEFSSIEAWQSHVVGDAAVTRVVESYPATFGPPLPGDTF